MAWRLQRWFRACRTRREISRCIAVRLDLSASRISALHRGLKGRETARQARIAIMSTAASSVQRIYRGRLGLRWFHLFRAMVREAKTRCIQRCFRGHRGRKAARRMKTLLESSITALQILRTDYLSGKLKRRICNLLENGSGTHGHGEKNEDAVVETFFLSCEDQTQLLSIALGITVTVHDYKFAVQILRDLIRISKGSMHGIQPDLLYAYSILLQLSWSRFGAYNIVEYDALDEALLCCEHAWSMDPNRLCRELPTDTRKSIFEDYEISYFRAAYAMALRKSEGIDTANGARACRNLAVCCHTIYGEFTKAARGRKLTSQLQWKTLDAYRRARYLFKKAMSLDSESRDVTLSESASVFENIFNAVWRPAASEKCMIPCNIDAFRHSEYSDIAMASIRAEILLYKCGDKCVLCARRFSPDRVQTSKESSNCSSRNNESDSQLQRSVLYAGLVIHEKELWSIEQKAVEFFLENGRTESIVRSQESTSLVGEFILPRICLLQNTSFALASPSRRLRRVSEGGNAKMKTKVLRRAQRAALRKKLGFVLTTKPCIWGDRGTNQNADSLVVSSALSKNQVKDPDENKGSYSCGWIETRIFCARIPALSIMRDALNHITIEDQAAHHLQTAYRGFQSRALWKRLQHRFTTKSTQGSLKLILINSHVFIYRAY